MSMKKFLVPALALVMFALTLTACGFAPASEGTAYAAGHDLYICISPSDDVLAGSETATASDVPALFSGSGTAFRLVESYYYPVSVIRSAGSEIYAMGGLYIRPDDLPANAVVTPLPEDATAENALPSLSLKTGETVMLFNYLTVNADDDTYTLRYLGRSEEDPDNIVFLAEYGVQQSACGEAAADKFEPFSADWHPVAQARRAELLAPEDPEPDIADGDLTGGEPSDALRVILIIGIAVPALIIVLLIFKPVSGDKGYNARKTVRRQSDRGGIDYDRERSYEADRDRYDRGYRDYERERPRDYDRGRDYDGRDRY